jgi:hypothetical protein
VFPLFKFVRFGLNVSFNRFALFDEGITFDGELLDIRDNHGRFFRTKAGANMSLLNQNTVLWGYIHNVAKPTARYGDPGWNAQYAVQSSKISEAKSQYKSAIKELIKDGVIEIKLI